MKQVIITVDTEGHRGSEPVERLIWGKTGDGQEYGINRIMDLCDEFSAKALFFVDVAEAWDYGKDKIAEVIHHIRNRGHDVGVHIHPNHMMDKKRPLLSQYSYDEQKDIIGKCTSLFREVTGEMPIVFRAGTYGANRDTLEILNDEKYIFDFSQFYSQKTCGIVPPVAILLPQRYGNLIEIPVTVFKSMQFGKMRRYDKVDATMNSSEYRHIMNRIAIDKRSIVVSLFYHSFSMLDWRKDPDNPRFNPGEEKKFIDSLKYVQDSQEFEFISLQKLVDTCKQAKSQDDLVESIISTEGLIRRCWYLLIRAYSIRKFNRKARWLIYGTLLAFVILIVIMLSVFF